MFPTITMPYLMPDDATGGGAAGGEGDEGTQQAPGNGEGQHGGTTQGAAQDASDRAPSANKQIKDFAAARGISVEDLLSKYQELEDAGKSESERLTGERDRYKSDAERLIGEVRELRSESAFLDAARDARARAPKTLFRAYKGEIEYDASGKPSNIAEVIAAAKADEPDLFQAGTGTSDAGRQGDSAGAPNDINALIRQMASEAR